MNILLFGATGMVGQGVLRECLIAADVQRVVGVGRTALGRRYDRRHDKLTEIVHDFTDLSTIGDRLVGLDACFFCLGVSAAGMSEGLHQGDVQPDDVRRGDGESDQSRHDFRVRIGPGHR